jgi:hypothetical protein
MRPTGRLHLGHLVGALGNWVPLQEKYDCFYFVADWHALTSEYANSGPITVTRSTMSDWPPPASIRNEARFSFSRSSQNTPSCTYSSRW